MEQQINHDNNADKDITNTNKNNQANREYKSRLFSYLFGREETKDRTLSLYNSLNGTNYTNPDDITITTIEDVIYMGMKNDLSYIVSDRASLYSAIHINEHQSSDNPNMPLREFMYAAKLYDKYLKMKKKNPYSSTIIPLPIPKLVVLYNGRTSAPDESIMRLSDAFREEIRQNLMMRQQNDDANIKGITTGINEEEVDAILKKGTKATTDITYEEWETLVDGGSKEELKKVNTSVTLNHMEIQNVMDNYLEDAMPGRGNLVFEAGYQMGTHKKEVEIGIGK